MRSSTKILIMLTTIVIIILSSSVILAGCVESQPNYEEYSDDTNSFQIVVSDKIPVVAENGGVTGTHYYIRDSTGNIYLLGKTDPNYDQPNIHLLKTYSNIEIGKTYNIILCKNGYEICKIYE